MGDEPKSLGENLGKRLTHVDAGMREKTIKTLETWIGEREKTVGDIDAVEMLQLWKGLHHTMWMTDKVPVQMQMCDSLASLSRAFHRESNIFAYFVAFFAILRREWVSIDYLRLDKYLSLIRRMVHEWMLHLERVQWAAPALERFADCMQKDVVMPTQPDGLRMHVAFVYLAELHRVGGALLDGDVINEMLAPFYCVLAAPPSEVMFKSAVDDVFVALRDKLAPLKAAEHDDVARLERFQNLNVIKVGQALYEIAASTADMTAAHRKQVYALAKRFGHSAAAAQPAEPASLGAVARVVGDGSGMVTKKHVVAGKAATRTPKSDPERKRPRLPSQDDDDALFPAGEDDGGAPVAKDPRRDSGASTATTKSVRFTHMDIVGIPKINRQMKRTPGKPAATMGKPVKSLLKPSKN